MPGGAARAYDEAGRALEFVHDALDPAQAERTRLGVDAPAHAVFQHAGLLHHLLEHEMLEALLLDLRQRHLKLLDAARARVPPEDR